MYTIASNSKHLYLRISNFFSYDYIEEHKKVFEKNGYVWILKTGRIPNKSFLDEIISTGGGIILTNSSRKNKKYYYCKLSSYNPKNDKLLYPQYYNEYLDYENYDLSKTLEHQTWLKISSFVELSNEEAKKFLIIKSNRKIIDCVQSRAVFMYLYCKEEIVLEDE